MCLARKRIAGEQDAFSEVAGLGGDMGRRHSLIKAPGPSIRPG